MEGHLRHGLGDDKLHDNGQKRGGEALRLSSSIALGGEERTSTPRVAADVP